LQCQEQTQQLFQPVQRNLQVAIEIRTGKAVHVRPRPYNLHRGTVRKAHDYFFPAHRKQRQLLIDERVMTANDGGF
jgi:hypothetical protein